MTAAVVLSVAASARGDGGCAMELSPRDAARARALEAQGAYRLPGGIAGGAGGHVVVPLAFHIVREDGGFGGLPVSQLTEVLSLANAGFAELDISFCTPGPVDFIDSSFFLHEIDSMAEIDALRTTHVVAGAINIYFVEELALGSLLLCGISSFTFSDVQGIVMNNACAGSTANPSTLVHEIGHYFDLFHTHEIAFGVECTSGSNCDEAGDLLCDTPADPKLSTATVTLACDYIGAIQEPCSFGKGPPYDPDTTNFMAYGQHICRVHFSALQQEKVLATLFNLRPELVHEECPTLLVTPTPGLTRVSLGSGGEEGDSFSGRPAVSADGRFVAFESIASTFAPGAELLGANIYVRDRLKNQTTLISVTSQGEPVEGNSLRPAISDDGRYVVFHSDAELVPGDRGYPDDVFVHDRETAQVALVSVSFSGGFADDRSLNAAISGEGNVIVFQSFASDLVPGDTNGSDVFARHMSRGVTVKVSEPYPGAPGPADASQPDVSADGRFVVFEDDSPNILPDDTNGFTDVFRRDLLRHETVRVSLGDAGQEPNWDCRDPSVSADGRFVAFSSAAPNITGLDAPGFISDIFVRDVARGITELISVSSEGVAGNSNSTQPSISDDGRYVSFTSSATNLVISQATNLVEGIAGIGFAAERVYRHDRVTGETILLSPGMGGAAADNFCDNSQISGNGLVVVFESPATNLVPADFNFFTDAFAFDMTPQLVGDLNGDGVVNGLDLALLLGQWGPCPDPEGICAADLNGDLTVNGFDLAILLSSWTAAP